MSNSNIPRNFYYEELFNALIGSTSPYYKATSHLNIDRDSRAFLYLKNAFLSSLNHENEGNGISTEECIHAIYSISLAKNSTSRNKRSPLEIKKNLIEKIANDFCDSSYASQEIDKDLVSDDISNDFRYIHANSEEIKNGLISTKSPVHSIQKKYFDALSLLLEKDHTVNKTQRKLILRQSQASLKYKDPKMTIKKALIAAGITLVAGSSLALGLSIASDNGPVDPGDSKSSETEITHMNEFDLAQKSKIALAEIYSNPVKLDKLGLHPIVREKFVQYLELKNQLRNGVTFSQEQQDSYDMIRKEIIDMTTTMKLDKVTSNSLFQAGNNYNITTPAGGVTAQVEFSIGDTQYSFDDTSIDGTHLALAKADEQLYVQKKSSPVYNELNLEVEDDDLDKGVYEALAFAMSDVTLDKDTGKITESPSEENILKILQGQTKDDVERS